MALLSCRSTPPVRAKKPFFFSRRFVSRRCYCAGRNRFLEIILNVFLVQFFKRKLFFLFYFDVHCSLFTCVYFTELQSCVTPSTAIF